MKREPVLPVDDKLVDATLPHLPDVLADMVRVQRLDRLPARRSLHDPPLRHRPLRRRLGISPAAHKTEHHGNKRVIFIGPQAQAVLLRYLARDPQAHCFRPCDSEAKRRAAAHAARKTPLSCGNIPGSHRIPLELFAKSANSPLHFLLDTTHPSDLLLVPLSGTRRCPKVLGYRKVSKHNLREHTGPFSKVGGLYSLTSGGAFNASRILLTDLICDLNVAGDPIATVTHRKSLYVCGSDDADSLGAMARLTNDDLRHEGAHSGMAFRLVGDEWTTAVSSNVG